MCFAVKARRKGNGSVDGVTEQTYYRWRRKYGGITTSDARKYRELETENARIKKLVANLSLDYAILKDIAEGTWVSPAKRL